MIRGGEIVSENFALSDFYTSTFKKPDLKWSKPNSKTKVLSLEVLSPFSVPKKNADIFLP